MENVGGALNIVAHKVKCKPCGNNFYEIDERWSMTQWVGSRTTDMRLKKCPHCGNENIYETLEEVQTADFYIEVDPITGVGRIYGGSYLPKATESTELPSEAAAELLGGKESERRDNPTNPRSRTCWSYQDHDAS